MRKHGRWIPAFAGMTMDGEWNTLDIFSYIRRKSDFRLTAQHNARACPVSGQHKRRQEPASGTRSDHQTAKLCLTSGTLCRRALHTSIAAGRVQ